jgi:GTP-binding protein EngB required for normal cell division
MKQRLFLLRMHEGTSIKSHTAEFTIIINKLDKIEVKIEDEYQALLLLCSLPYSYKSFRKAIIYRGKQSIKINEVKEHLLNKEKIDN